jgi:hypothetical protein
MNMPLFEKATPMKTHYLITMLLLAAATAIAVETNAQEAAKPPASLKVVVGDVTDTRLTIPLIEGSGGPSYEGCKLELKFTGDATNGAFRILQVHVTKAVDELGHDLTLNEVWNPFDRSRAGLAGKVKLRNPSRAATVIKLVEGEVKLFYPTPANGSLLVIKDILKHPAEPVQDPTLKKYGLELMYLTKEDYEAKKKQLEQEIEQKQQRISKLGLKKPLDYFSEQISRHSRNNVILYLKAPDDREIEVAFQDNAGKPLKPRSSLSAFVVRGAGFDAPLPADTQLLIYQVTPEATHTFPFKVEDVPLP